MVTLPASDIARPGEVVIPQGIRPLHTRLTGFFDYYTGFFQQPYLEEGELWPLAWAMTYGVNRFYEGLGLFIPARLGITPASTTKLITEKILTGVPLVERLAANRMSSFIKNSFRRNGLPENFAAFQDYNPTRDRDFSKAVLRDSQGDSLVSFERGIEEVDEIFDDFRKFQGLTRADVLRAKNKQLVLSSSASSISEIRVAPTERVDDILEGDNVVEIEAKPPKRKRLLFTQAPEDLPAPVQARKQVFIVDYSRTAVAELLKLPHNHQLVDRFMQAIQGFEWGEKKAEDIHSAPGHVRIKVGNRRIALEHLGGTNYALRAIGLRDRVYAKKGLAELGQ